MLEYYDVAQICLNGHMINDASRGLPQHNETFCSKCGERTITSCPKCSAPLRGQFQEDITVVFGQVRGFCYKCGDPYPWTETALNSARFLAEELDELNESDKAALSNTLDDLVKDSPRTHVAALRFKKLMAKTKPAAVAMMKQILEQVVVENVKHYLWGSK